MFSFLCFAHTFRIEIAIQVVIVFVGGAAFQVVRIQGREWGISLALGFVSIPWGVVIRCMPNGPFKAFFRLVRLVDRPEVLPTTSPDKDGWAGALDIVRDNLSVFSTLRGGRLGSSAIVTKARSSRIKEDDQMTVYVQLLSPDADTNYISLAPRCSPWPPPSSLLPSPPPPNTSLEPYLILAMPTLQSRRQRYGRARFNSILKLPKMTQYTRNSERNRTTNHNHRQSTDSLPLSNSFIVLRI